MILLYGTNYKLILLESLLLCDFSGLCDSALLMLFLVLIDVNSQETKYFSVILYA